MSFYGIINDLMKIEADVYFPEYRGEFSSIEKKFEKFKDMFILAYDGAEIIRYLCYFPISEKHHEELVSQERFHDDIEPEETSCLISSVVSKQGESLANNNGFELIKDCMETEQYKLYKKDRKNFF